MAIGLSSACNPLLFLIHRLVLSGFCNPLFLQHISETCFGSSYRILKNGLIYLHQRLKKPGIPKIVLGSNQLNMLIEVWMFGIDDVIVLVDNDR